LQLVSNEAFEAAKELLQAEVDIVIQEKRSLATDLIGSIESDYEMKESLNLQTIKSSIVHGITDDETPDQIQDEFNSLTVAIKVLKKQNDKMEQKLSIKNGGYSKRCSAFSESSLKNFAEIQHSRIEESVYRSLMGHEQRGMANRIEKLEEEIENLQSIEAKLQKNYGDLMHEKNRHKLLTRQKEHATLD
jgi:predicted Mrr-cat superfamily restriction endonuclease